MGFKVDQKVLATVATAAGGALAALAGSDAVSPQVAAYCSAAVIILTALGMYKAPPTEDQRTAIALKMVASGEVAAPPARPGQAYPTTTADLYPDGPAGAGPRLP